MSTALFWQTSKLQSAAVLTQEPGRWSSSTAGGLEGWRGQAEAFFLLGLAVKDCPIGTSVRISYRPAAERIPYSHAEEKKQHVLGPGGVFFS